MVSGWSHGSMGAYPRVSLHHPRKVYQAFEYLAVLDVEATCESVNVDGFEHEVIELPVVLLQTRTMRVVREFRAFVKPQTNPVLSEFCTNLTGITQMDVDKSQPLSSVLARLVQWLRQQGLDVDRDGTGSGFAFVTDGPWDLNHFLDVECRRKGIKKPQCFDSWINIRWLFADFYKCRRHNVERMLARLGRTFEGRAHSGIDDARNIARIVQAMAADGARLVINDGLSDELSVKWRPTVRKGRNCPFVSGVGPSDLHSDSSSNTSDNTDVSDETVMLVCSPGSSSPGANTPPPPPRKATGVLSPDAPPHLPRRHVHAHAHAHATTPVIRHHASPLGHHSPSRHHDVSPRVSPSVSGRRDGKSTGGGVGGAKRRNHGGAGGKLNPAAAPFMCGPLSPPPALPQQTVAVE
mmetsp:Transcript_90081/g.135007  ORF Transcript_90081/g.135007 Transcript_90081/m.135007 type:complete len:408 (+) Transcript_90081:94-1317(+)